MSTSLADRRYITEQEDVITELRIALAKAENEKADLMAALAMIDIGPPTVEMSDADWVQDVYIIAGDALAKARGEK